MEQFLFKMGFLFLDYLMARGMNLARVQSLRDKRVTEGHEGLTPADHNMLEGEMMGAIGNIKGTGK